MRDGGIRSKLKLEFRKGAWVARGYVPVRNTDGTIARRRVERGLGTDLKTKAARQAYCDRLNEFYERRALEVRRTMSFAKAYTNYVEAGHAVPYMGEKILRAVGTLAAGDIDDTAMLDAAKKLWPRGAKPSTINRELYTPVIAILNMASRSRACARPNLTRPKGHTEAPPMSIPTVEWFQKVLPFLTADKRALLSFLTVHGRRLADGLARVPSDFDPQAGTLAIGRDKSGNPLLIELAPGVRNLLLEMPDWRKRNWLFNVGPNSASNVRRDILIACLKAAGLKVGALKGKGALREARRRLDTAGMTYHAPHSIGRHSFATRLLRAGYSLHHVKESGGWATIGMVSQRYGHLARSEVTTTVHEVGAAWLKDAEIRGGKRGEEKDASSKPIAKNR